MRHVETGVIADEDVYGQSCLRRDTSDVSAAEVERLRWIAETATDSEVLAHLREGLPEPVPVELDDDEESQPKDTRSPAELEAVYVAQARRIASERLKRICLEK